MCQKHFTDFQIERKILFLIKEKPKEKKLTENMVDQRKLYPVDKIFHRQHIRADNDHILFPKMCHSTGHPDNMD